MVVGTDISGKTALLLVESVGRRGDPDFALGPEWREDNGDLMDIEVREMAFILSKLPTKPALLLHCAHRHDFWSGANALHRKSCHSMHRRNN